mgnify:CR=1 FL=1
MSREEDRELIRELMGYCLELQSELDAYRHNANSLSINFKEQPESKKCQESSYPHMVLFEDQKPMVGFNILVEFLSPEYPDDKRKWRCVPCVQTEHGPDLACSYKKYVGSEFENWHPVRWCYL